jgi:hypothetical protein
MFAVAMFRISASLIKVGRGDERTKRRCRVRAPRPEWSDASRENGMTANFTGTYGDLIELAAAELRQGISVGCGMEDAESALRVSAVNAVARFRSPLDLFKRFPETMEYDFGELSFASGLPVGEAMLRLAESMVAEELVYEMNNAIWGSFDGRAFEAALACFERAVQLSQRNVGLSEWAGRSAGKCRNALLEDGRVEQETWSVLKGAVNGANDLLSGWMGDEGAALLEEMGGRDAVTRLKNDCSRLAFLLFDDADLYHANMTEAWQASHDHGVPASV